MTRRILVMFALLAVIAVALGFYALHLKRKVARDEQARSGTAIGDGSSGQWTARAGDVVYRVRQRRHVAQDADQCSVAAGAQRARPRGAAGAAWPIFEIFVAASCRRRAPMCARSI